MIKQKLASGAQQGGVLFPSNEPDHMQTFLEHSH